MYGYREVYIVVCWENLRNRDYLEYSSVDRRIILSWMFRKWDVRKWTR
jgi:hypothetical protein